MFKDWWLLLMLIVTTLATEPETSSDTSLSKLRHDDDRGWQMRTLSGSRGNIPDPIDDDQGFNDDSSTLQVTRPRRRRRKRIHSRPQTDNVAETVADYDEYAQEYSPYREKIPRQHQSNLRNSDTISEEPYLSEPRPYRVRPRRRRLKPRRRQPSHYEQIDDAFTNVDNHNDEAAHWEPENGYNEEYSEGTELRGRRYRQREHYAQEDYYTPTRRTKLKSIHRTVSPDYEAYNVNHETTSESEHEQKIYSNNAGINEHTLDKFQEEHQFQENTSQKFQTLSFNPDRQYNNYDSGSYNRPTRVRSHKPYTLPPTYVSRPAEYNSEKTFINAKAPQSISESYLEDKEFTNDAEKEKLHYTPTTENSKAASTPVLQRPSENLDTSQEEYNDKNHNAFKPSKPRRKNESSTKPSSNKIFSNDLLSIQSSNNEINKHFDETTEFEEQKNATKHQEFIMNKSENQSSSSSELVDKNKYNTVTVVNNNTEFKPDLIHEEYDDYTDIPSSTTSRVLSPHLLAPRKRPLIPLRLQESPNIDPMKQEENSMNMSLPYVHRELSKYAPKHRASLAHTYNQSKEPIKENPQSPIPMLPPVKIQYEVKSIEELIQKTRESLQMRLGQQRSNYSNRAKPMTKENNEPMRISIDMDKPIKNVTNSSESTEQETFRIEDEILELLRSANSSARLARVLASRNMTLSDLIDHRERGSSKHHLADIFEGNASNLPDSQPGSTEFSKNESARTITSREQTTILDSTRNILNLLKNLSEESQEVKDTPDDLVSNIIVSNTTKENDSYISNVSSENKSGSHPIESKLSPALAKLFEPSSRKKSRVLEPSQVTKDGNGENPEPVAVIQKSAPYPIPIWVPVTYPPYLGSKSNNINQNISLMNNTSTTENSFVVIETVGKVHKMGEKGILDINSLHEEDDEEEYHDPDTNDDYGYEELPAAMKSAIIASSAILILTIFIFFFIFVGCRWRQRRARRRFINGILNSRPRSPMFDEHSQIEEKCVINSRSLTPVLVSSTDLYKNSHETRQTSRNYYFWNTIRKTLRYK